MNEATTGPDYLTEAWCIVNHYWLMPWVGMENGQVEIIPHVQPAPQVRPGEPWPVLRGQSPSYRGKSWEEAVRAMALGEKIDLEEVERLIVIAQEARRNGTSIHFA